MSDDIVMITRLRGCVKRREVPTWAEIEWAADRIEFLEKAHRQRYDETVVQKYRISALEEALQGADALLTALNPHVDSGLSDAETARLFNATHEEIRRALESKCQD